jgi:hypothetical protein
MLFHSWFNASQGCATKHADPNKYFITSFFYPLSKEVAPDSVVLEEVFHDGSK